MRRIYLLCVLLVVSIVSSWGADANVEHVTMNTVALQPGGDSETVSVHLSSASRYTAIFLDINLPEGLAFAPKSNKGKLVYAAKGEACYDSHGVSAEIQTDGSLRVVVFSSESDAFWDGDTEVFKFYVKANPLARPGYATIEVKNCQYVTPEAVPENASDIAISGKISVLTSAKAPLSVAAENKWSTLILPFDAPLPDGVKAYRCSSNDEAQSVLCLTSVSALKAFVPYILYSETGYEGSVSGEINVGEYPEGGVVADGLLRGALTTQQAQQGDYVLANKGETKFYRVATTKTIPAGKCWVSLGDSGSAKENFGLQVVTGISNVVDGKAESSLCYTIDGIKVSKMTPKRLYIVKGRKVIGK